VNTVSKRSESQQQSEEETIDNRAGVKRKKRT